MQINMNKHSVDCLDQLFSYGETLKDANRDTFSHLVNIGIWKLF
jgi:hypothetical protein